MLMIFLGMGRGCALRGGWATVETGSTPAMSTIFHGDDA